MAQSDVEMLAACGLDCGPCPIRRIPFDPQAAENMIAWFKLITCLDICPALGAITVGDKVAEFDARAAEIVALQEAVRHARSTEGQDQLGGDKWVMLHGLPCYDRWIDDWRSPEQKRTSGDSYCLGVYRSTHRAAAGFMRELELKYPQVQAHFERAAAAFIAEADALDAAVPLLGWDAPDGPDPERNAQLVPLLRQARDGYARGIGEIEAALDMIQEGAKEGVIYG